MSVVHSPVVPRKRNTPQVSTGRSEEGNLQTSDSSREPKVKNKYGSEDAIAAVGSVDGPVTKEGKEAEEGELDEVGEVDSGKSTGMDQVTTKQVGKLDDSVYKIFGQESVSSLSRSSSNTSSEGVICNGGPGKKTCGNPVKDGELGVECDMCHAWFHAVCQATPRPAIKALEKFESLAWLCADCKAVSTESKKTVSPFALVPQKYGQ